MFLKSLSKSPAELIRKWSATGLNSILECPRRRFLDKKIRKKVTWPDFAKGTHMHRKIEELRTNHLRPLQGKNSRYKSTEAYANVVSNDWQRSAIEGEMRGDKILWEYENQPYVLKKEIKEICLRTYPMLTEEVEKAPAVIFKNITKKGKINFRTAYEFEFIYKGRGFSGEMDEIRKEGEKIIIRDYKTGKWKYIEDKLNYASQPTQYEFAVCALLIGKDKTSEEFREALGITKEQAKSWIKAPEEMSENIIFEYFMLDLPQVWDKEKKEWVTIHDRSPIIRVEREKFHYKELIQNIDMANAMQSEMEDRAYYPPFRGHHCKRCFYQQECNEMTKDSEIYRRQSLLYDFMNIQPRKQIKISPLEEKINQAQFDFMKEVKKMRKPKR